MTLSYMKVLGGMEGLRRVLWRIKNKKRSTAFGKAVPNTLVQMTTEAQRMEGQISTCTQSRRALTIVEEPERTPVPPAVCPVHGTDEVNFFEMVVFFQCVDGCT